VKRSAKDDGFVVRNVQTKLAFMELRLG
jgi:hypothetical protein